MPTLHTVRVKQGWLDQTIQDEGGMKALAEKLGCAPSTITRQANGTAEAGPRFIGAVLSEYPIDFDDAFEIAQETARPRRTRVEKIAA